MFGLGIQELVIILVIVLIIFGGRKLPELARAIGQSMKELRRGFSDSVKDESKTTTESTDAKTPRE